MADAVTHARFVGTDPASDEVVLMKILQVQNIFICLILLLILIQSSKFTMSTWPSGPQNKEHLKKVNTNVIYTINEQHQFDSQSLSITCRSVDDTPLYTITDVQLSRQKVIRRL